MWHSTASVVESSFQILYYDYCYLFMFVINTIPILSLLLGLNIWCRVSGLGDRV